MMTDLRFNSVADIRVYATRHMIDMMIDIIIGAAKSDGLNSVSDEAIVDALMAAFNDMAQSRYNISVNVEAKRRALRSIADDNDSAQMEQ